MLALLFWGSSSTQRDSYSVITPFYIKSINKVSCDSNLQVGTPYPMVSSFRETQLFHLCCLFWTSDLVVALHDNPVIRVTAVSLSPSLLLPLRSCSAVMSELQRTVGFLHSPWGSQAWQIGFQATKIMPLGIPFGEESWKKLSSGAILSCEGTSNAHQRTETKEMKSANALLSQETSHSVVHFN